MKNKNACRNDWTGNGRYPTYVPPNSEGSTCQILGDEAYLHSSMRDGQAKHNRVSGVDGKMEPCLRVPQHHEPLPSTITNIIIYRL